MQECRHLNHFWQDPRSTWTRVEDKVVCEVCGTFYGYIIPPKTIKQQTHDKQEEAPSLLDDQ